MAGRRARTRGSPWTPVAAAGALTLAGGGSVPAVQLQEATLTTKDNVGPFIQQHP